MAQYKKDTEYFGWDIKAKRYLTDKEYRDLIYERNKEKIDKYYEVLLNRSSKQTQEEFRDRYKDAKGYFVKQIKMRRAVGMTTLQATKALIKEKLALSAKTFASNAIEGLKTKFPARYQEAVSIVGEELDYNKIQYKGDGTYEYTGRLGSITITFTNSPEDVEIVNSGAKGNEEDSGNS